MSIGQGSEKRFSPVAVFTWVWILGSVVASAYFALFMFPRMVETKATIFLQTKVGSDVVYWPNSQTYRKQFLGLVSDKAYLYYSACSLVAPSQNCDQKTNWYRLDPRDVGCVDVESCKQQIFYIPTDQQSSTLAHGTILSVQGTAIAAKDPNTISLSNPVGWGDAGRWPVFFITLFFAVRLGRGLGEFLFAPYSK